MHTVRAFIGEVTPLTLLTLSLILTRHYDAMPSGCIAFSGILRTRTTAVFVMWQLAV